MALSSPTFAIRARYLFPVASPPIEGGLLTISNGRIVAVGENTSGDPPRDIGNVAILPGLVNAHTHLEFSNLPAPLGTPVMPFTDWIREVVRQRAEAATRGDDPTVSRQAAVNAGLAESRAVGVTALGEIATPGWPAQPFASPPPAGTVFLELLGLRGERVEPLWQVAAEHLQIAAAQSDWRAGLSPHAPYSVNFELFRRVCRLSAESGVPLAMHLAETAEELELLAAHSGPFLELLTDLGAWDAGAIPRGIRPFDYLRELSTAARALVIHGNYLTDAELTFMAEHRDRMSLIYCPRTHAYFGYPRYALPKALALGVNVALGTDSRASNPDLSLLAEMRHVARAFPEVSPAEVLRMGTHNGASALGLEREFGSLEPGKRAAFCMVPLSDHSPANPHELLFESDAAPIV